MFRKLLSSAVDYDYILTKLDDIGMGGMFVDNIMMMGGMDINTIEVDDMLSGGGSLGANGR